MTSGTNPTETSSSSSTTAVSPGSRLFPWAASPDIIRSSTKDESITHHLFGELQTILGSLRGPRYVHAHSNAIRHVSQLLYLSLTTLLGHRTLGEEYCDVIHLDDETQRLPSFVRRTSYVFTSAMAPWLLDWLLPTFRRRLRAKLERSLARLEARSKLFGPVALPTFCKMQFQAYILKHLNFWTSTSPVLILNLAAFYFSGAYYHVSKRFWRLRYAFTKRVSENEERVGYEVLGVLLLLQIIIRSILHIKETFKDAQMAAKSYQQEEDEEQEETAPKDLISTTVYTPPSIPSLPADTPRYTLENQSTAAWISDEQQRKCTLCLEAMKDPSVTTCGHVFCWVCIRDWVKEKPECPLCRQKATASKLLPLRV